MYAHTFFRYAGHICMSHMYLYRYRQHMYMHHSNCLEIKIETSHINLPKCYLLVMDAMGII